MVKNRLVKLVLGTFIMAMPLMATNSEYSYDSISLVGIEGGFDHVSADITNSTVSPAKFRQDNKTLGHLGLKIGAQGRNYRVFLGARYYVDQNNDFDYIATYGVDVQYLFNMSTFANFFVGVNGGMANMKFIIPGESFSRTINDPYFGGDAGFNIHASEGIDIELGARYMNLDATNDKSGTSYRFNSIVSGYGSIIFKYHMD